MHNVRTPFLYSVMTFVVLALLLISYSPATATTPWNPVIYNRAVYSVATNPLNPRTVYAGNQARLFFKSFDGGETWEELSIGSMGGSSLIQCMLVHPRDTNVVFAGGSGLDGLMRSTNGGETWTQCLGSNDGFRFELGGSGALTVDPLHPDTMYCVRFYLGEVYRSVNRGESWELLAALPGIESSDNMRAVTVCPSNSSMILVSGRRSRIYRSTDYGATFEIQDSLTPWRDTDVANFAWSPSVEGTVYAAVQMSLVIFPVNSGLFKSTDYGRTWERRALQDTSLYAIFIRPTPNGDELFLGGNQFDFPADPDGLLDGDSIVLRSIGTDTHFDDLSTVPWMENEIGEIGVNVWGFAETMKDGYPILLMATNGGLFSSDRITSVQGRFPHPPRTPVVITPFGFLTPNDSNGMVDFVIYDLHGRTLQTGTEPANTWVPFSHSVQSVCILRMYNGQMSQSRLIIR